MKFGVFLNQYYTPDDDFEVTDLYEQAAVMEDVGFDGAALGERHIHDEGVVEPLTTLSALASHTDTLDLATMAILPGLYHPIHLAEKVAMIDRLSEGRMHFGAAIGYRERELVPFGLSLDERVPVFLESLSLLKRFWTEETVSHEGDRWQFDDVLVSPRPADRIPVWIGGHADIAIKRAAYRGDAWIASASSTVEDLRRQIAVYEDALAEFDNDRADHAVVLMRDGYVADSYEDARAAIEPHVLRLYRMYARWSQTYLDEHDVDLDFEELAEKFVLGSPERCVDTLETYESLGVDQIYIRCQFPGQSQASTLACLERLGEEVIPAFQ